MYEELRRRTKVLLMLAGELLARNDNVIIDITILRYYKRENELCIVTCIREYLWKYHTRFAESVLIC